MEAIAELRDWLSEPLRGDRTVILDESEARRCRELLDQIEREMRGEKLEEQA